MTYSRLTLTRMTPTSTPPESSVGRFGRTFALVLGTTATLWFASASAQTAPANPAAAAPALRFQDFFRLPIGPKGLEISDALRQADGQTVRLTGYMVQNERPALGRFMLTPRPVQMSEHADGDADDLPPATVTVYLDKDQSEFVVPHVRGLVEVSGRLSVGRYEEADGRVSWVRLKLNPDATRAMNPLEISTYLHQLQHSH